MNSNTRRLDIVKQNKIKMGSGAPKNSEGSDGDQQIRVTSNGIRFYVKFKNKWYYTSMVSD